MWHGRTSDLLSEMLRLDQSLAQCGYGTDTGAKIRDLSWSPPGYGSAIAQQDDDTQQHKAVKADAHKHLSKARISGECKGAKLDGWAPDGARPEYIG